jgi:hypothetical protein
MMNRANTLRYFLNFVGQSPRPVGLDCIEIQRQCLNEICDSFRGMSNADRARLWSVAQALATWPESEEVVLISQQRDVSK